MSSPRPLKRSASVASLPTPPRTVRKRKRRRDGSRDSTGALSATEEVDSDQEEDDGGAAHDKLVRDAEAEESFWKNRASTSGSQSQSPPLLYRRLQQAQPSTHALPVSPPPSHRKPPPLRVPLVLQTPPPKSACSSAAASPPVTPPSKRRDTVIRDSPDNPFLVSPLGSQDEAFIQADSTSTLEEKPTVAFVFRGVKRNIPNPYYSADGPAPPNPNSQLPPEHPDFEPDERGVRKLLFGVRRKKNPGAPKSTSSSRRAAEAARGRKARRTEEKSSEAAA